MQVFVTTYSGDMGDEPVVLSVCSTVELAIKRAEARIEEVFDEEPSLSQGGWYMDTLYDVDTDTGSCITIVALFDADGTCTDAWNITEETVESQS